MHQKKTLPTLRLHLQAGHLPSLGYEENKIEPPAVTLGYTVDQKC